MTGGIGGQSKEWEEKRLSPEKRRSKEREYRTEEERDKHNHRPLLLLYVNKKKCNPLTLWAELCVQNNSNCVVLKCSWHKNNLFLNREAEKKSRFNHCPSNKYYRDPHVCHHLCHPLFVAFSFKCWTRCCEYEVNVLKPILNCTESALLACACLL